MAKTHPLLEPYRPTEADPFDAVKAAHLLARAGFGGTLAEIQRVQAMGPIEAVEWLMDFPDAAADEQPGDTPDLSGIEGYPRTFNERRKMFEGKTPQERMELNQMLQRANREAVGATATWWVSRMASGACPLQEKLTLFWHGHFTTSARDERSAWLMWQQNETLRRFAAGNFGTFVKQISRDPAMLDYLNNQQNRKGSPNENYARELMELFTLGIGRYTEIDIKEAARAFTGWGHDGDDYVFRPSLHDGDAKTFFGLKGKFDGDDVIDIILKRPECATYIATKLFSHFAYDGADEGLQQALGSTLRSAGYELRPLLFAILTSKAFYSSTAIGTQIKSPIQLVAGAIRQMGLPGVRRGDGTMTLLEQMGQVPLNPPNVKGWPGGRTWINTSTLFVRFNTAIAMASRIGDAELMAGGSSPEALVRYWVARLIGRPIDEGKQAILVNAVGERPTRETVRKMLELVVSMPDYQLC